MEARMSSRRLPPPHFRGFDPHGPFTFYQRHLPHWRQPGATYFVTYRLADSLPQGVIDYISRMRHEIMRLGTNPSAKVLRDQYEQEVGRRFESSLDEGHGQCVFQDTANAKILDDSLQFGSKDRYFLGCTVVMPNHCHILIRPYDGCDLEKVLGSIKGYTAHQINKRTGSSGELWQEECYDRIVRDEEHLYRVIQYIGRNPAKCGLPSPYPFRWINPTWRDAGWNFEVAHGEERRP